MKNNLFTSVIIAAAGIGSRMQNKIEKPFIPLNKVPLVIHTLQAITAIDFIDEIILIISPNRKNEWAELLKDFNLSKNMKIVDGGSRRQDSVANGFYAVNKKSDIILIHDGARPFIDYDLLANGIEYAAKYGVSIPVTSVKPTIKKIDKNGLVTETINRAEIVEVQTPQCFKYDILEKCLKNNDTDVTDEATLAEHMGFAVKTYPGYNENIKVTTPEDIIFAEQILKLRKK